MSLQSFYQTRLDKLQAEGQYRYFPPISPQGKHLIRNNQTLLNLSSNDYLGLNSDIDFRRRFLTETDASQPFGSTSSRLLTGNYPIYDTLEQQLTHSFQREAALLFNSGYHANIGILPALADKHTLILADKYVHASIIDGIRLSQADSLRYRHNDYAQLTELISKKHNQYRQIIIATESLFSMDGDTADLPYLVALKKQYNNIMLYVDEAHAIGALGANGLGLAEVHNCIADIDLLVGTFGKAIASSGAYLICDKVIKHYLINTMRPLIFSTALSPIVVAWTSYVWRHLSEFANRRQRLITVAQHLRHALTEQNRHTLPGDSFIVPYIIGRNDNALSQAQILQQQGLYCLPIRPPTVPKNTARIRFSLTADLSDADLNRLIDALHTLPIEST